MTTPVSLERVGVLRVRGKGQHAASGNQNNAKFTHNPLRLENVGFTVHVFKLRRKKKVAWNGGLPSRSLKRNAERKFQPAFVLRTPARQSSLGSALQAKTGARCRVPTCKLRCFQRLPVAACCKRLCHSSQRDDTQNTKQVKAFLCI
jgi:hypothetical protein